MPNQIPILDRGFLIVWLYIHVTYYQKEYDAYLSDESTKPEDISIMNNVINISKSHKIQV